MIIATLFSYAYDRYSLAHEYGDKTLFNRLDANSLALRLMSETGLYGLLLTLIFLTKYFVRQDFSRNNSPYWIISSATLIVVMVQLARMGNYTYNGFMFFIWLYYFNFKKSRNISNAA